MKKVLIIILSYNAARHIGKLLSRIPRELFAEQPGYRCGVLLLDDASQDETAAVAQAYADSMDFPITILHHAVNKGYGGNQKIGYRYAIEHGYDIAVMLHGDEQYPPERIGDLVQPIVEGQADAVLGSRMRVRKWALEGRMPLYKFVGNIVLTTLQNRMLGASLSEFHTGFRAYRVGALKALPLEYNSNDFDFDTDILIQLMLSRQRIGEIAIRTHYGEEKCHVNGPKYALQILRNTLLAKCQRHGLAYRKKFDLCEFADAA